VTIVFSDLHLGKVPSEDASSLHNLLKCIDSYGDRLDRVLFLGDTFDAFIEYPNRIPKLIVKWTEMALGLKERGLIVEYFAGNHDRWHLDFLQKQLQLTVRRDPHIIEFDGKKIWFEHGDDAIEHKGVVGFLKSISSKPWVYQLYRAFLPFGWGQNFVAWVSRNYSDFGVKPKTVLALRQYAFHQLNQKKCDVIVMGHCHEPSIETETEINDSKEGKGVYVNTGNWYQSRTFAIIKDQISVCTWTPDGPSVLHQANF